MDGPSFGKAMGDAIMGMIVMAAIVGLLIGGCSVYCFQGCNYRLKIERVEEVNNVSK